MMENIIGEPGIFFPNVKPTNLHVLVSVASYGKNHLILREDSDESANQTSHLNLRHFTSTLEHPQKTATVF